MEICRLVAKRSLRKGLPLILTGLVFVLLLASAQAQLPDFDDLYLPTDNEFTLEIETEETAAAPEDLITIDPISLEINRKWLALVKTDLTDSRLVHAKTFQDGAHIQQGSDLLFKFAFHGPKGLALSRRASLFSKLADPKNPLHDDTEFELNDTDNLALNWRRHSGSNYLSVATINDHLQQARRRPDAGPRKPEQSDYTRNLFLETANLRPGDYKIVIKVYRKDGDDIPETDFRSFRFTLVEAPIAITAFIPDSIAPYNDGKSLQTGEYEAGISDWAVPPYRITLESSVPGFSMDYAGQDMFLDTSEVLFDLVARPRPDTAGRTAKVTLRVTDGLGRKAVTHRRIRIGDGKNAEIKVSLPKTVQAGQTVTGRVTYPSGFTLKKRPKIGDERGFTWTNSNYTEFQLTPKEEGVHHKRLFAIIASGTMAGMDQDPVLVWKREYTVKSQDLIYDEARNRRRTEASNRAWKDALGAIAAGVGEAAAAYESSANSSTATGGDSTYEIVGTETFEGDSKDEIFEIIGEETHTEQSSGGYSSEDVAAIWERVQGSSAPTSTSQSNSSGSGLSPEGVSGQLDFSNGEPKIICGIDNSANDWTTSWDGMTFSDRFYDDIGVPGGQASRKPLRIIELRKKKPESGTKRSKVIEFHAKNCVLKMEYLPLLDEYTVRTYWDNGGKRKVEISDGYKQEWDRTGNVTEYWPKEQGSNNICSNSNEKYKRCSR